MFDQRNSFQSVRLSQLDLSASSSYCGLDHLLTIAPAVDDLTESDRSKDCSEADNSNGQREVQMLHFLHWKHDSLNPSVFYGYLVDSRQILVQCDGDLNFIARLVFI